MKASRCAWNSINVTQIYVSTIYFILKQGYMFRLERHVTHKDSTPEQLHKNTHSGHNTTNKSSIGQSIKTVSTPNRRYSHPRCRTSPNTGSEKTADKTTKYVTTTKSAGKLYPKIPCNDPESDTGWKTQLSLSNKKNRSTPTSAIIRKRNSQLNIRWTSTHCSGRIFNVLMFKHNL